MIERLARITLPDALRDRLGLTDGHLTLQRAWPRSGEHLMLDFRAGNGPNVAGQWMKDPAALERVARQTARQSSRSGPGAATAVLDFAHVLLQPGGADGMRGAPSH